MANTNNAIKLIKNNLSGRIDGALTEHAGKTESWAGTVRLLFAFTFAAAAGWSWSRPDNAKYIFLALAVVWLAVKLLIDLLQKQTPTNAQVSANTLIDVTIVNLGLLAFVQQGIFPTPGGGLFLCYFPILAVAANRYRMRLVIQAGLYAMIFYGILAWYAGSSPWLRLAMLGTTVLVFVMGSRKPRTLVAEVADQAIDTAFDLGVQQTEMALMAQAHQLFMPPPIVDLPALWCTSKHGAGSRSSGDYYRVFETERGPIVIVGDLGGQGFEALADVKAMHEELSRIVARESSLPKILESLNAYLYGKYKGDRPFTCVIAEWKGEEMHYINAGHLPMIQMSKPHGAHAVNQHTLPVTCGPVGVQATATFTESVVPFPIRDLMVVYTDGVFAKLTTDRAKGIAEIEAMAEQFSGGEVNTLCHRIFDCAQPGFDRNPDDSTVVVIRHQPEPAHAETKAAG